MSIRFFGAEGGPDEQERNFVAPPESEKTQTSYELSVEDTSDEGPEGKAKMENQLVEAQNESEMFITCNGDRNNGTRNFTYERLRKINHKLHRWGFGSEYKPDLYRDGQAS